MSQSIEQAHDALTRKVIDWAGVTGTAIGLHAGKPCLKVYVTGSDPALRRRLPSSVGGFRVVVEETGVIRPL